MVCKLCRRLRIFSNLKKSDISVELKSKFIASDSFEQLIRKKFSYKKTQKGFTESDKAVLLTIMVVRPNAASKSVKKI